MYLCWVIPIFILRYLDSEELRRRVNLQLNKGEALHYLRQFIFFANEGKIRKHQIEEQMNQAGCLNLVTNAVIVWNTVYINAVVNQLKEEGYKIDEADLTHIFPVRFDHINPYGRFFFNLDQNFDLQQLRPLRRS